MMILHGLLAIESYLKQISLAGTMLKPKMAPSRKHSGAALIQQPLCSHFSQKERCQHWPCTDEILGWSRQGSPPSILVLKLTSSGLHRAWLGTARPAEPSRRKHNQNKYPFSRVQGQNWYPGQKAKCCHSSSCCRHVFIGFNKVSESMPIQTCGTDIKTSLKKIRYVWSMWCEESRVLTTRWEQRYRMPCVEVSYHTW